MAQETYQGDDDGYLGNRWPAPCLGVGADDLVSKLLGQRKSHRLDANLAPLEAQVGHGPPIAAEELSHHPEENLQEGGAVLYGMKQEGA